MRLMLYYTSSLLALVPCVLSTSLLIHIPSSGPLANPNTLSSNTHATIQSGTSNSLRATIRNDNTLFFPEIPTTGSHLLSIFSSSHIFAPYRLDISPQDNTILSIGETYPGSPWSQTGPSLLTAPTTTATISAKCLRQKQFYDPRPAFEIISLFKNPMILLGIVALAFTFGMPKMLEGMDPETRAEFDEMQSKGVAGKMQRAMAGGGAMGPQAPPGSDLANFDLAGWMAGQKQDSDAASGGGRDPRR